MTKVITAQKDSTSYGAVQTASLQQKIASSGRFPPVSLNIKPLDPAREAVKLDRFLSYNFNSSILIPVDNFSFTFVAPDSEEPLNKIIKEGDIVQLTADNIVLATGIIDTTELEVDSDFGEKGTVNGRDLMGQLEDHDAIDLNSAPIYANRTTIKAAVNELSKNTRVENQVIFQDAPTGSYLFATEPGESKLSALARFLEPLNCVAWMSPDGKITVGRPNMKPTNRQGKLILSKSTRDSNVTTMRATRSSATIANVIVPVWSAQESVVFVVGKSQAKYNYAEGPARLYKQNHRLPKTMVISNPQGGDPSSVSQINQFLTGGNLFEQYALRELARQNVREVVIQAVVPGHYNDAGQPFKVDTVYTVIFDRGDVQADMYLYAVEYKLSEDGGQQTLLSLCNLGSIVSGIKAK